MKKTIITLALTGVVVAATAVAALAYTGHAGCPGYIPPYSGGTCASHTSVRKIGVWANAYHEVVANGPSGGACKAAANTWCWIFLPYDQTVRPSVLTTARAITSLDGEDYQ